jgi:SM-20-related protein
MVDQCTIHVVRHRNGMYGAPMDQHLSQVLPLGINPALFPEDFSAVYASSERLHVPNFLLPGSALALYDFLVSEARWRTFVVADQRQLGTPCDDTQLTADDEREINELAHSGARTGYASIFEADRIPFGEAEDSQTCPGVTPVSPKYAGLLRTREFIEWARAVTGISDLGGIELQATRFRPGHFITFRHGTPSADKTGKRRINFELNLTPEWKPEWGGLLAFRGTKGHAIEAIMPCFNSLDLFAFPQGHWISVVSPFANGPRYSIVGALYALSSPSACR